MARFPTPHTAQPTRVEENRAVPAGQWIEGEPGNVGATPVPATTFPCFLFLPQSGESEGGERSWRPRSVRRPTIMFDPAEVTGKQPGKEDELLITAPELAAFTGGSPARWQVEGIPQPFGPPGVVIGAQVALKQVTD